MTWIKGWSLALILVLPLGTLRAEDLKDAYKAFEKGQYDEAAQHFQKHTKKQPQDYDQLYNTGVALFKKGDPAGAIPYFDQARQSPDPQLKSRAAYNKGVALSQQQRWEEAEAAFQEALSYDNDNRMIQDNLNYASAQKKLQKQEMAKDDPQGDKQKPEQEKNGEEQAMKQEPNGEQETMKKDPNGKDAMQDQKQAQNGSQSQSGEQKNQQSDPKGAMNQQGQTAQQDPKNGGQGQPAHKPDGKGQPQAKESMAGQDAKEQNPGQPKDAMGLQPDDKGKAGQPDPKGQAMQAGEPKDKNGQPVLGAEGGAAEGDKNAQRVLTIKDLKKQEAEKLLRSVEDRIGSYILTPEQANTEGKSRNGKDW